MPQTRKSVVNCIMVLCQRSTLPLAREGCTTTARRIALAFFCMLLAFAIFATLGTVPLAVRYGLRYALPTVQLLPVYLLFSIFGWFLALPFVILFKNADGWRTWAILVIGTAIGPCLFLGWPLIAYGEINWQGDGGAALMSFFIGFLTTTFYVLLLRRFTRSTAA